jgi:hypothetical protein
MLPKNRLGRALIKKLKVYPTAEHPHAAQKPQPHEGEAFDPDEGWWEPAVEVLPAPPEPEPEPEAATA